MRKNQKSKVPNRAPTKRSAKSGNTETKASIVLKLLQRSQGATMSDLVGATGWLPHTTRAALTGLRKKGHAVEKTKREDVTCYRITKAGVSQSGANA